MRPGRPAPRAIALSVALCLAGACRTRDPAPAPPAAPSTSPSAPATPASALASDAPSDASVPPAPVRGCKRDDECAVARIETSGPLACCGACGTTPGTRRWHADFQRWCAARPLPNCPPLACPQGPTRAVCRAGACEAVADGEDGGPTYVPVERRCLPGLVCDTWAGCVRARGNGQDGWFVEEPARVPPGEIVSLERVAVSDGGVAEGFRMTPSGVTCPPHTILPLLPAPPRCVELAGKCVAR